MANDGVILMSISRFCKNIKMASCCHQLRDSASLRGIRANIVIARFCKAESWQSKTLESFVDSADNVKDSVFLLFYSAEILQKYCR